MPPDRERQPLLGDHVEVLRSHDFCLSTGLDRASAENLFRTELLEYTFWTRDAPSRPASILMDKLPSRESLVAMGLPVRDDYDPANPRHGGIDCAIHGWVPTILVTRDDPEEQRELPDRTMCWECSRAGVPPDQGNSVPIEVARVERWRRTHDHDGSWMESEGDE